MQKKIFNCGEFDDVNNGDVAMMMSVNVIATFPSLTSSVSTIKNDFVKIFILLL